MANASINSFDQFLSPHEDATLNSSGVVTSDTFNFSEESWITYRDTKNPNTTANRFNTNAQFIASAPGGVLNNAYALRAAYLNTQYGLTPTTGSTQATAHGRALSYLRDLSAYESTIKSLIGVAPSTLTPLPDEPGQPDYAWADVQAGAVAFQNNGERFLMNADWRNYEFNNNSFTNLVPSQIARVDYATSTIERTR